MQQARTPWRRLSVACLGILALLSKSPAFSDTNPPSFLVLDAGESRTFDLLRKRFPTRKIESLMKRSDPASLILATRDPVSISLLRTAVKFVAGLGDADFDVRILKHLSRRSGKTLAILHAKGLPAVAMASVLSKSEFFEKVSLDARVQAVSMLPDDPLFPELWGLNNEGRDGGLDDADIDAPEAWDHATGNGESVIAVIDTGILYTHPDLVDNIWTNPGEVCGNGLDDDGNGYVDDCHGIDVHNGDSDPIDDNGHGTHVAGTIAAVANNAIGVAGINWHARLLGCKFLDESGYGLLSGAMECLDYLIGLRERGINVIASNNSWGSPFRPALLDVAIRAAMDAGIAFIAAAGNFHADLNVHAFYPCSYPIDGLICVAATDPVDEIPAFSNRGERAVDVAAPGVGILSTVPVIDYIPLPRFQEDAEGGSGLRWKVHSNNGINWRRSDLLSRSPTHSWIAGDSEGRLVPGQVSTLELDQDLDLSDLVDEEVYLHVHVMSGVWSYSDYLEIHFSADGGRTWERVASMSGNNYGTWREWEHVIADRYKTSRFRIKLVVHAESGKSTFGFAVDDMGIRIRSLHAGYERYSGTSMATPHVTGAYSLVAESHPGASIAEIEDILVKTSDPIEGFEGKVRAAGRINLASAVELPDRPRLRLSVRELHLGDVEQDRQSPAGVVRVKNVGQGDLEILGLGIDGPQAADYRIAENDCTTTLAFGQECRIGITLQSAHGGIRQARLVLVTNDPETPEAGVALSGYVIPGEIRFEGETPLDFGSLPAGDDRHELKLRFRNVGEGELEIDGASLAGSGASQYRISKDGCAGRALRPRKTCEIRVRFEPVEPGRHVAGLQVRSDDPRHPLLEVALTGRGLRTDVGAIGLDSVRLDFEETETADVSDARKLRVRNVGYGPLVIRDVRLGGAAEGDYRIDRDDCTGRTLKRGKRCELRVRFAPGVAGERVAELRIRSNDPDFPEAVVSIKGKAVPAPPGNVEVSDLPIVFDPEPVGEESSEEKLRVRSLGPGRLVVRAVRIVGEAAGDFTVDARKCQGGSLRKGKSCELKLRFVPAGHGEREATLEVETNDGQTPVVRIPLRGRGLRTDVGAAGVDPDRLIFGEWGPGEISKSLKIKVRNMGYGPLRITGLRMAGDHPQDFRIDRERCIDQILRRGKSCEVRLRFSGSDAGLRSAALMVESNDPDAPELAVPLSGEVVPQDISLDTGVLDFGVEKVGERSSEKRIRVVNRGLGRLEIRRVALQGEHAGNFLITRDKCGGRMLKPGKKCELKLRYVPITPGVHQARLRLESNDPDEPVREVLLSGTGK